jgi:hypothetical protein
MGLAGVPVDQVWRKQEPLVLAKIVIRKRGISFSYFFTPFSTFSLLFSLFPFEKVMKKEEKVHQKCPFSPYSK